MKRIFAVSVRFGTTARNTNYCVTIVFRFETRIYYSAWDFQIPVQHLVEENMVVLLYYTLNCYKQPFRVIVSKFTIPTGDCHRGFSFHCCCGMHKCLQLFLKKKVLFSTSTRFQVKCYLQILHTSKKSLASNVFHLALDISKIPAEQTHNKRELWFGWVTGIYLFSTDHINLFPGTTPCNFTGRMT